MVELSLQRLLRYKLIHGLLKRLPAFLPTHWIAAKQNLGIAFAQSNVTCRVKWWGVAIIARNCNCIRQAAVNKLTPYKPVILSRVCFVFIICYRQKIYQYVCICLSISQNRAAKVNGSTPESAIYTNEHAMKHLEHHVPDDVICTVNCWEKKRNHWNYA